MDSAHRERERERERERKKKKEGTTREQTKRHPDGWLKAAFEFAESIKFRTLNTTSVEVESPRYASLRKILPEAEEVYRRPLERLKFSNSPFA